MRMLLMPLFAWSQKTTVMIRPLILRVPKKRDHKLKKPPFGSRWELGIWGVGFRVRLQALGICGGYKRDYNYY